MPSGSEPSARTSFEMKLMTSMRKPSTPRSSHQPHHGVDRRPHLGVLPVEVRLLAREQVQVVLTRSPGRGPRPARRTPNPVGRLRAGRAGRHVGARRAPPSTSRAWGCPVDDRDSTNHGCSSEVWLTTRFHHELHTRAACTSASSASKVRQRAEQRLDPLVVTDVVPRVVLRRRVTPARAR